MDPIGMKSSGMDCRISSLKKKRYSKIVSTEEAPRGVFDKTASIAPFILVPKVGAYSIKTIVLVLREVVAVTPGL